MKTTIIENKTIYTDEVVTDNITEHLRDGDSAPGTYYANMRPLSGRIWVSWLVMTVPACRGNWSQLDHNVVIEVAAASTRENATEKAKYPGPPFAFIERDNHPRYYVGWAVELDSPRWTFDPFDAAPVPLEILMDELNRIAAHDDSAKARVYPSNRAEKAPTNR